MVTAAAMFFAVPAAQTAYADTQAPVKYVDENGTEHQVNSYTVLKNDMTEIGSADGTWYVVNENVTFENNLKVKDNAKAYIILCDGKNLPGPLITIVGQGFHSGVADGGQGSLCRREEG